MAWSTPKVDWTSSDVVADTDLNRIEANTASNRERFEISSKIGSSSGTVSATGFVNLQQVAFTVNDDIKIVLKNARYKLFESGLQLRVRYDIGGGLVTAWTSTSEEGDDTPDQTIYSNTTGSPVSGFVQIEAYNPTGSGKTIAAFDGYSLTLEKEDV